MLKITECGIDYEIEYGNDNVRNVLIRHIEQLQERSDIHQESSRQVVQLRSAIRGGSADWKLGELTRTILSA